MAAELIVPQPEKEPPSVPMDYSWAQELGLIRKPASFMSSICDERGEELLYAGMPISDVFKVLSLIMWQSRVEIKHYSVRISLALLRSKRSSAELPLRAGLICAG